MRNYIIFNGESSAEYDIFIGDKGSFGAPKKKVTKTSIPGRNGDLVFDQGIYNNINASYTIVGMDNFRQKINHIKEWLLSPLSYARLEDTYNPDYYRMAMVSAGVDFTMKKLNEVGKAKITFDCKPQRFLKSGDFVEEFTAAGDILNPTRFKSKPIITVYGTGSGSVMIGSQYIALSEIDFNTVIDCDLQDCYNERGSRNLYVSLGILGSFPELESGLTQISFDGGVTKVSIQGKWWTL